MDSGERVDRSAEDRSGFWLPPAWTVAAAYVVIEIYFVLIDENIWRFGYSLVDDPNIEFRPLTWPLALESVSLFVAAFVLHRRRQLMVPLVAIGVAARMTAYDLTLSESVTSAFWWTFVLPAVLTPAVAGLAFARWSRGAPDSLPGGSDQDGRQSLRLPSAGIATAFVLATAAVYMSTVLLGIDFAGSNRWISLPFNIAGNLTSPALFVAAFVIARPRAFVLAPAVIGVFYAALLISQKIDAATCTNFDGESVSCTAQMLWGLIHVELPTQLIVVAAALLASRWSRWGQVLPAAVPPAAEPVAESV